MKINSYLKNLIVQKVTGLSKEQLFLNPHIPEKFQDEIAQSIKRLEDGEPIEYIIEKAEFYGIDFFVDNRVLIPRNDTEVMVDRVLKTIKKNEKINVIDVGTGSGCLPISILKNKTPPSLPLSGEGYKHYAVDISKDALEVARVNIKTHGLENIVQSIESNLLDYFLENKKYPLNENLIITANLPYIKNGDFENLDKETMEFEPDTALYGGESTGFELYEKLISQCMTLKKQENITEFFLFIEIGFDQKEVCKKFLKILDLSFDIFKDNGGIERCVKIEI